MMESQLAPSIYCIVYYTKTLRIAS